MFAVAIIVLFSSSYCLLCSLFVYHNDVIVLSQVYGHRIGFPSCPSHQVGDVISSLEILSNDQYLVIQITFFFFLKHFSHSYPTVERRALPDEFARYHQLPPLHNSNSAATNLYTPYPQLPSQGREYQDSIAAHSSNSAAPVQCTTSGYPQQVDAAYFPLQREASHQDNAFNSNLMAVAQYASSVLQRLEPVPYDQSSLRGTQYHGGIQREAQYTIPDSQAAYLPPQREALYQDNVVPYNSHPTVLAQSHSVWQPQASALNLPLQSEASHQANMAAYNSNPIVAAPNIPVRQPEVLPYASAPVPSYYPYPSN